MVTPRKYELRYQPKARRELVSLPRQAAQRIALAIERLADEPRPPGCVKLAGGGNTYRIRIGDYRVLYEIEDENPHHNRSARGEA